MSPASGGIWRSALVECCGLGRYGFGGWKAGGPAIQSSVDVGTWILRACTVMKVFFDKYAYLWTIMQIYNIYIYLCMCIFMYIDRHVLPIPPSSFHIALFQDSLWSLLFDQDFQLQTLRICTWQKLTQDIYGTKCIFFCYAILVGLNVLVIQLFIHDSDEGPVTKGPQAGAEPWEWDVLGQFWRNVSIRRFASALNQNLSSILQVSLRQWLQTLLKFEPMWMLTNLLIYGVLVALIENFLNAT